jgi:hypothetical protein
MTPYLAARPAAERVEEAGGACRGSANKRQRPTSAGERLLGGALFGEDLQRAVAAFEGRDWHDSLARA